MFDLLAFILGMCLLAVIIVTIPILMVTIVGLLCLLILTSPIWLVLVGICYGIAYLVKRLKEV